jgi:hypothetical protein
MVVWRASGERFLYPSAPLFPRLLIPLRSCSSTGRVEETAGQERFPFKFRHDAVVTAIYLRIWIAWELEHSLRHRPSYRV